jgi:hypothetical protein
MRGCKFGFWAIDLVGVSNGGCQFLLIMLFVHSRKELISLFVLCMCVQFMLHFDLF